MFDSTRIETAAPYPQHIHEHRAPTDDSVKIMREMWDRAKNAMIDCYSFEDNALHRNVTRYMNFSSMNEQIAVTFSLNGHKHRVFVEQSDFEKMMSENRIDRYGAAVALQLLIKCASNAIAAHLANQLGHLVSSATKRGA